MKLRIVQYQCVTHAGKIFTRFSVQRKGWFFWHTEEYFQPGYDGGDYYPHVFKKYEDAEAYVVKTCEQERARRLAEETIKPKTVLVEVDCGK